MLNSIEMNSGVKSAPQHALPPIEWDINRVWSVLRRQYRVIAGGVGVGFGAALIYYVVAQAQYTATVAILLDTPKVNAVADSYDSSGTTLGFETGGIDSQVEVLKSERIALGVIRKGALKDDPHFNKAKSWFSPSGIAAWLSRALFGEADENAVLEGDRVLERKIIGDLKGRTDIKRIGRTYVIELKYTNPDKVLASKVANLYADQYLVDQLDAKYDATTRAAVWLQDRISELRDKSLAADTKVQNFRSEHGLIAVDGKLVDEQALADANSQLSDARAKMADADAKAQRIEAIIQSGNVDAAVTESLANPVIADLRTKYLTASKRESDIAKKLGSDHIAAANLRQEMREYERLLFEELRRIGESYRSDFQISKSRLASLEANLAALKTKAGSNNQELVQLRDLIRESETYKTLYETFLQRYQTVIQQQSFPINDARVITSATPPIEPSWPKGPLLVALGIVLGAIGGIACAVLLERRDSVFRTGEQVQQELGLEFLGLLPVLGGQRAPAKEPRGPNVLGAVAPSMIYAVAQPFSGFAETMRAVKVGVDIALRGKTCKIVGVVSVMPGEGKTTVAKNLASQVAHLGARAVLVDCDLRNPGLTRSIAHYATDGLVEVLKGEKTVAEVGYVEPESGLVVIPAVVHRRTTNSSELLSSEAMKRFLRALEQRFDYVFLDLPPVGPVIDVRASADLIDSFLFVVEWGKTERALVRATLDTEREVYDKCLGIILNKVDETKFRLYEGTAYRNYYYSKYSKYYTS